jgi:hypothetical protein
MTRIQRVAAVQLLNTGGINSVGRYIEWFKTEVSYHAVLVCEGARGRNPHGTCKLLLDVHVSPQDAITSFRTSLCAKQPHNEYNHCEYETCSNETRSWVLSERVLPPMGAGTLRNRILVHDPSNMHTALWSHTPGKEFSWNCRAVCFHSDRSILTTVKTSTRGYADIFTCNSINIYRPETISE